MLEEKEDYFESRPEDQPKREKAPKEPKYKPDDPRYYYREEGKWDHLKPSPYRRASLWWAVGGGIVAIVLLWWLFSYLFSPYVKDAVQYGYVDDIHREGRVFDTYEGVLLPYKSIKDTVRPYEGDFVFSTKDEHLATEIRRYQFSGNPVMVHYKVYGSKLPWRGKSRVIVTGVDSVDPRIILPPDRRPERP